MLRIITVCGLGVGSSLIMKMTVDSAMNNLGIKCDIKHWDMGTVDTESCDIVVTTKEFKKNFENKENIVFLENMISVDEATTKLKKYLSKKGLL